MESEEIFLGKDVVEVTLNGWGRNIPDGLSISYVLDIRPFIVATEGYGGDEVKPGRIKWLQRSSTTS
jgi:hypothetical protein